MARVVYEHLCGSAIVLEKRGKDGLKNGVPGLDVHPAGILPPGGVLFSGRPQGSLINYQKRQIQNAIHWMANFPYYGRDRYGLGPLVFVCTTSPSWGPSIFAPKISQFVHNLKSGYGIKNFVWVREFTKVGLPHYHFIADAPSIRSPVGLSRYWSSLFGGSSPNCIRLGSKPDRNGKRTFRVNKSKAARMARYVSKYLGKQFEAGEEKQAAQSLAESMGVTVKGRKFGISYEVARNARPVIYHQEFSYEPGPLVLTATGEMVPGPTVAQIKIVDQAGNEFNQNHYKWKQAKQYPVWFGTKRISKNGF